jgi:hypothetical protein
MKKVIHKEFIPLGELNDVISLLLPVGSQILAVGNQYETMAFWYLFNESEKKKQSRHFRIAGTGHTVNLTDGFTFEHLGTVQFNDGRLVLHVFEIEEVPF